MRVDVKHFVKQISGERIVIPGGEIAAGCPGGMRCSREHPVPGGRLYDEIELIA